MKNQTGFQDTFAVFNPISCNFKYNDNDLHMITIRNFGHLPIPCHTNHDVNLTGNGKSHKFYFCLSLDLKILHKFRLRFGLFRSLILSMTPLGHQVEFVRCKNHYYSRTFLL